MKKIKHQNLDGREKMCFNCCNVYSPDLDDCPICFASNGMLINEDNRNAMQIRHMIMRDRIPIIPDEKLIEVVIKEHKDIQQAINWSNKIFHYIISAFQFFQRDKS